MDAIHFILKIISLEWSFSIAMNYARYDFLFWDTSPIQHFLSHLIFFDPFHLSLSLSVYHLSSHLLVFTSLLVFSNGAKFHEWAFFPACSMSFLYVHISYPIEMLALPCVSRGVTGEMIGVFGFFSLY